MAGRVAHASVPALMCAITLTRRPSRRKCCDILQSHHSLFIAQRKSLVSLHHCSQPAKPGQCLNGVKAQRYELEAMRLQRTAPHETMIPEILKVIFAHPCSCSLAEL